MVSTFYCLGKVCPSRPTYTGLAMSHDTSENTVSAAVQYLCVDERDRFVGGDTTSWITCESNEETGMMEWTELDVTTCQRMYMYISVYLIVFFWI